MFPWDPLVVGVFRTGMSEYYCTFLGVVNAGGVSRELVEDRTDVLTVGGCCRGWVGGRVVV